jgi:hypothetical protein
MSRIVNLLKSEHSRVVTDKVIAYVGADKERFKELVTIFLKGEYRLTQHAAWPLSYIAEAHPELILPHLNKILKHLEKPDLHDAIKRNTFRFLQVIDFPAKYDGIIADLCFQYLQGKEAIAVKVFAMSTLMKICERHKELAAELKVIIEDQLPYSGPAFKSRGMKVLKQIEKMK